MNWRKIISIFVAFMIIGSSIGAVSAAKNNYDYKYYYEIDGQTYYQIDEFGIYPPFVAHPDVSGVYENVTVYDSDGNVVGVGTITRYSGKIMHYSADIIWDEPEVPTTNNTNIDGETTPTGKNYADNGTKYRDTVTSVNNVTQEANSNDNTKVATSNNTNTTGNNNTTGPVDGNNDEQGIPMEQTGGVISIVSIAMIILIIMVIAKIVRRDG